MENNFEQENLNKRVLEKLQNKIAVEEFKCKENIEKRKRKKMGFKVASLLILGILAGNVYTYAAFNENLFSFILSKAGLINDYSEKSMVIKEEKISIDDNILTLESYAMNNESLVVTYNLKLSKKYEFEENMIDISKIVDGDKTYGISESSRVSFYKILDTEYEIVKIYDVGNLKVSDNARFVTSVTIYKELNGPVEDKLGVWEFDINIVKNNDKEEYKTYALENKVIDIYNLDGSRAKFGMVEENAEPHYVSVKIEELSQTDLGTKIVFSGDLYTNTETYVEILDEKGNVLLANNTEKILGNPATEILFSKIDLNSKIIINIDVVEYPDDVVAEGSIVLDLSKDLVEKSNKKEKIDSREVTWNEIIFGFNDDMEMREYFDNNKNADIAEIFIYKNRYGKREYETEIDISRTITELSLEQYAEFSYMINLSNGEIILEDGMVVYSYEHYDIELTCEEIIEIVKSGEIIKNGKKVTKESLKENSRFDASGIINKKYSNKNTYEYEIQDGEDIYKVYILEINDYKYEFKIPEKISVSEEINDFISSIKI